MASDVPVPSDGPCSATSSAIAASARARPLYPPAAPTSRCGAIGGAPVTLEEPIWDPVVEVSDRLATVWVKYAFYADEQFSHCGVDAFQLFKSEQGWKIFQIADTRRREDCWEPPA